MTTPRWRWREDGVLVSESYGDIFHPRQGALAQAEHVFLAGNALPQRWLTYPKNNHPFVILELGFGLGINFLATYKKWRELTSPPPLQYLAVELHPWHKDDLMIALNTLLPDEENRELAQRLVDCWPTPLLGINDIALEKNVALTLLWGDALAMVKELLPQFKARVDAIYLDGFSPRRNPAMWSQPLCQQLAQLIAVDGRLSTYTIAGSIRRHLTAAHFSVHILPGFAGKRGMLVANKSPTLSASPPPASIENSSTRRGMSTQKEALIIGGGLAGCATARALVARGWKVQLLDRQPALADETSGNPIGLFMHRLEPLGTPMENFSRQSFLYLLKILHQTPGAWWRSCGVLKLLSKKSWHDYPDTADYIKLSAEQLAQKFDLHHPAGALWFAEAGILSPRQLCRHLLPSEVSPLLQQSVHRIERHNALWRAQNAAGETIAAAATLILACNFDAQRLLPELPLAPIRGQITYLPSPPFLALDHVRIGRGYLTPAMDGQACLGATYAHTTAPPEPTYEDHCANLAHLARLYPDCGPLPDPSKLQGRVGYRCVTPDRWPLVGHLGQERLYGLVGLGARGIVFAPFAAELLASQITDEFSAVNESARAMLALQRFEKHQRPM